MSESEDHLRLTLRKSMGLNGDMQTSTEDPGERTLTNADVQAIANAIWRKGRDEFYNDLGKGVWSAAKAVIVAALIALAAYGSWKGMK